MGTDKEKWESTEFIEKSRLSLQLKSIFLSIFRYETTIVFHPANSNRVSVSDRFYPCPSVKSVVQFLWLRQSAAPRSLR